MLRSKKHFRRSVLAALAFVLALSISTSTPQAQSGDNPQVIPPNSKPYGLSYAQWSARWEQWLLSLPVAGNPQLGCPNPPNAGQSGPVWFITPQFGAPASCSITIPAGKAVFVPLAAAYFDSLTIFPPLYYELLTTEEEQRYWAQFFGNHIVPSSLFCEIDGVPMKNLGRYRFTSPQFQFTAPSPWIGGDVGGPATAVADGYYLILHPLPPGTHTIRFGGAFHLSVAEGDPFDADVGGDTTYYLTVQP